MRQPLDAAFQYAGDQGHVVLPGDLQAVDHVSGGVRRRVLAPAGEPAPAAVGKLHIHKPVNAFLDHVADFILVEHRVAVVMFPLLGTISIFSDFLRIQVRPFFFYLFQIELHVQKDLLRNYRRQKPIQRLLRAAIRVIDHIRQGIDHCPGQRGRISHLEPRLLWPALFRHVKCELAAFVFRSNDAGVRIHFQHPVDIAGEFLLHGVRFLVGHGFHTHYGLAFVEHFYAPIYPGFGVGINLDRLGQIVHRLQCFTFQFERHLHGLFRLQVVVDNCREHDLVGLHEEPWGFHADDEVLAGDYVSIPLADFCAVAHAPDLDPPGGQILGHVERYFGRAVFFGRQSADPKRRIGELRSNGRLNQRGFRGLGGIFHRRLGDFGHCVHGLSTLGHACGRHGSGHSTSGLT